MTGRVRTVAALPAGWGGAGGGSGRGGSWSRAGQILLGPPLVPNTSIMQVDATGGTFAPALAPLQGTPFFPAFLADDRRFFFTRSRTNTPAASAGLYVAALGSPGVTRVAGEVGQVRVIHDALFFVRDDALWTQALDPASAARRGEPRQIVDGVAAIFGRSAFSVSDSGTLVYTSSAFGRTKLTWVTRSGAVAGTVGSPGQYQTMALSPDGQRLVFGRYNNPTSATNLWVLDLARNIETRLTFGDNTDSDGTWAPDMSHIIYASMRSDTGKLLSSAVLPAAGAADHRARGGTTRGRRLVARRAVPALPPYLHRALGAAARERGRAVPRLRAYDRPRGRAGVLPDSQWVAFHSSESGRFEVYLTRFPPTGAGERLQVSANGGVQPQWNRNGRELFFLTPEGTLMAVDVQLGAARRSAPRGRCSARWSHPP